MPLPFRNRTDAGRQLASKLAKFQGRSDLLVLALPRGGVPVAYEVANILHAPMDVFLVRKLGVPGHEELAFGAIASGGLRVINQSIVHSTHLSPVQIEAAVAREKVELARRERSYRGDHTPPDPKGLTVILVDDGLATGATMLAAARALRQENPKHVVIAVPVAAPATCNELRPEVDEIICAITPEQFHAVGLWYEDFSQITDEEVRELLERSSRQRV
jgi:putative phosphoribosyl transferase